MEQQTSGPLSTPPQKKERLLSLDAFRGFTILGMVFVIAVAAGQYQHHPDHLPQKMSWFGSLPISTWFHADVGYHLWEAAERERLQEEFAGLPDASERIDAAIAEAPEARLKDIGLTFTDLIAPWFVFIVGVCVPLSRRKRGGEWWRHVMSRTLMLILAGMLYISLVIQQVSWWWGVLQAIGVAYFMAACLCRAPASIPIRWGIVLGIGFLNLLLTEFFAPWTRALQGISEPFGTLSNPGGNWLRPLTIHCLPWLSISYGVMAMIGVLVGDAIVQRDDRVIIRRCLVVAAVFMGLGYLIHALGFATERYTLAFNKPDVTTSYAFFSAGFGALVFLGFYYVADMRRIRWWVPPLVVFGANPLLAYFMMIIMRRIFQTLGVVDFFNLVGPANTVVMNWATWIGGGEPSRLVLAFFDKGGYMGVFWGLVWTFCVWLIIVWCNRKNLYWRL